MAASDPQEGSPGRRRRSSFTEMFARPSIDTNAASGVTGSGPRTSAMASAMQQRARRMSITSVGLSGSPNGQNPASAFDTLRGSQMSSGRSGEDAVEDDDEVPPLSGENGSRPDSPSLARRFSFGSRAYRASSGASSNGDTGLTSDGSSGSPNGHGASSSPPGTKKGMSGALARAVPGVTVRKQEFANTSTEGFNWSESLRARAQRSSISAGAGNPASFMPLPSMSTGRSRSVADQGGASAPQAASPPAPPPAPKAPDHFQERILKGDFYMD
ncbi:MAG: hypothetical protein Q9162_000702 [Coniocarpon cinnabarinum]